MFLGTVFSMFINLTLQKLNEVNSIIISNYKLLAFTLNWLSKSVVNTYSYLI